MDKNELVRYHTLDGSSRDLRPSPTGAWVRFDTVKKLILGQLSGISRMVRIAGAEGEADAHNECIYNIEALFEGEDPLDTEIADAEKKLTDLKERKVKKIRGDQF